MMALALVWALLVGLVAVAPFASADDDALDATAEESTTTSTTAEESEDEGVVPPEEDVSSDPEPESSDPQLESSDPELESSDPELESPDPEPEASDPEPESSDHEAIATTQHAPQTQQAAATCVALAEAEFDIDFNGPAGTATVGVVGDLPLCEPTSVFLASYEAQGPTWPTSLPQHLYDLDVGTGTEGGSLSVAVPACFAQVDLVWGDESDVINPIVTGGPTYTKRGILLRSWIGGDEPCVEPEPEPWPLRPAKHWNFVGIGDAGLPGGSVDIVVTVAGEETVFTFDTAGEQISGPDHALIPDGAEYAVVERNLDVDGWSCRQVDGFERVVATSSHSMLNDEVQAEVVHFYNECIEDEEPPPTTTTTTPPTTPTTTPPTTTPPTTTPPTSEIERDASVLGTCEPSLDVTVVSLEGASTFEVWVDGELEGELVDVMGTEELTVSLTDFDAVDVVIRAEDLVVLSDTVAFDCDTDIGGETTLPPTTEEPPTTDGTESPTTAGPSVEGERTDRSGAATLPRTGTDPMDLVTVALALTFVGSVLTVSGRRLALVAAHSRRR